MGAGQSGGVEIAGSSMGYQVLRVYPNSPGSKADLQAYFDFIVAAGNTRFHRENGSLREILKASIDQKLKLIVYNTRSKKTREVEIVPSTTWGGNGLLGVSIKHSSFDGVDERVWHVLNVEQNSPAFHAGLKSSEDYVIGSDSILQESEDLYNLIEAHESKPLKLFVYNVNSDNCREVVCTPKVNWGGSGSLGCEFGHGYLHRIPYRHDINLYDSDSKAPLLMNQTPMASEVPFNTVYGGLGLSQQPRQQQQQQYHAPVHSHPIQTQHNLQRPDQLYQPSQQLMQESFGQLPHQFPMQSPPQQINQPPQHQQQQQVHQNPQFLQQPQQQQVRQNPQQFNQQQQSISHHQRIPQQQPQPNDLPSYFQQQGTMEQESFRKSSQQSQMQLQPQSHQQLHLNQQLQPQQVHQQQQSILQNHIPHQQSQPKDLPNYFPQQPQYQSQPSYLPPHNQQAFAPQPPSSHEQQPLQSTQSPPLDFGWLSTQVQKEVPVSTAGSTENSSLMNQ